MICTWMTSTAPWTVGRCVHSSHCLFGALVSVSPNLGHLQMDMYVGITSAGFEQQACTLPSRYRLCPLSCSMDMGRACNSMHNNSCPCNAAAPSEHVGRELCCTGVTPQIGVAPNEHHLLTSSQAFETMPASVHCVIYIDCTTTR